MFERGCVEIMIYNTSYLDNLSELTGRPECTNLKDKFYPSPSNFFKIARTIFGVIIFQDCATASLQNDAFDFQAGRPVLAYGMHSMLKGLCQLFLATP